MAASFLDNYFSRYNVMDAHISEAPDPQLYTIVVIPSYNEPDIMPTLLSLVRCKPTRYPVEVIVVINSKVQDNDEVRRQNDITISQVSEAKKLYDRNGLRIHYLREDNLPQKHAGVGFARKIGMDEAVRRFAMVGNNDGVIVSLDADCTCNYEYLSEIEGFFTSHPKAEAVSIYFQHDIDSDGFPEADRTAVAKYELYLRYYIMAQRFAGFPYAIHTMGSAFAVRMKAYCLEGGMNRRQGGEDFYFLQKIIPRGRTYNLNSAIVYPSIRRSQRVPFGTGITIIQMESLEYDVFNVECFKELRKFFSTAHYFYSDKGKAVVPDCLEMFLKDNGFYESLPQMVGNAGNVGSFLKRFYTWFDAFRLLKCLNYIHMEYFRLVPVEESASQLLDLLEAGYDNADISARALLKVYRELRMDV